MARASFYVIVLATLNRVPLMLPILSLPGPEPATPEPIYPPQPPYQDEQGQWQPGFSGDTGSPDAPWTPEPGRQLSDSYEDIFYTAAGTCPNGRITEITAGKHKDVLTPPAETVETYEAKGLLGTNGDLTMDYPTIDNGGSMCITDSNPENHIILGGMFFWETGSGQCMLPPTDPADNPCCMVYMWQTNAEGMYYGDCTMKMDIQSTGLYYFKTVIPGPETDSGWGEDPEPHFAYDIVCSGCVTDEFADGSYAWWGKVYPEGLCTDVNACGNPGTVHQVQEKSIVNGEVIYTYDFVLPKTARR